MIQIFMLTMLVINQKYVGATIGVPCQDDSDCVTTSEACSLLGRCQCKAGYMIHIFPHGCNPGFDHGESCQSQCMVVNTTIRSRSYICKPSFYQYQGSCYLKGDYNDTCYTAEGCRDTENLVCSNPSGAICVCQNGSYYKASYTQCVPKVPVGSACYVDDACIDEHAWCNQTYPPTCRCMDGYFEYQGSCILKGNHNDTCYTAEGCRDRMNLVCSNPSGGICVCQTGSYYEKSYTQCVPMPDAPKNLLVLNVTATAFTIWLEKPNEVFGELLGYVLTIKLADTGRCVIEYLIRCESGCVNPFPNQTTLLTTCHLIIQYQSVSKQDLVMMKRNINTLNPGAVYWVSVAAVNQYGKGFTADINVTTLHEGDLNVGSHLESNSMTTIIIVSITCGTLMVIALMAAGTVIIIKRKRASQSKSEADAGSTYMDLPCKTNEDHYDTLAVTSAY